MSTARHPRTDGLIERFNQTMHSLLHCYSVKSGFDWTSYLSMVEFDYNYSIYEAPMHSSFEVMYRYQPSILADRLVPLTNAIADAATRLTLITYIRDVVYQLLKLCILNTKWQIGQLGLLLLFNRETLFIFRMKVYTFFHINANTLGSKVGSIQSCV